MDKATQIQKIYHYMLENKGITQREAMMRLGVGRLAARISDMKKRGYKISTEMIKTDSGSYVARYSLDEPMGVRWNV